jgi:hypothetical protein
MAHKSPVSPLDCPHHGSLFIASHRSTSPPERYHVSVCPRCGQFSVTVSLGGLSRRITFDLLTRELVEAAGRYCKYLERNEEGG